MFPEPFVINSTNVEEWLQDADTETRVFAEIVDGKKDVMQSLYHLETFVIHALEVEFLKR